MKQILPTNISPENIQVTGLDSKVMMVELDNWQNDNKTQRLWAGDASVWTQNDESQWLGWLNIAEMELHEVPTIEALAKDLKKAGFQDVVVLGMGGSSLCPALMAATFDKIEKNLKLHVLDSTDPMQIQQLENDIDLKKTMFIVSSKSGSTLEPNIFKQYFYQRLQTLLNQSSVSDRFIAITDPGSSLEKMAKKENFKAIFLGVPTIGGRYSALSNFGMVPSGLMGLDIHQFLRHAQIMVKACSKGVRAQENPGVILGIILGFCANQGKDKVTLIVSPEVQELGAWLEQLLAESTGKMGKGLIPVDRESLGPPEVYGQDRVFIYTRLENSADKEQDRKITVLEQAGFVVVRLPLKDKMHLGAAMFLWEMATAVAGSLIGINPFNQPDVEEAKVRALQLTSEYDKTQKIASPSPFFKETDFQLFSDPTNVEAMHENLQGKPSVEHFIRSHLNRLKQNDYLDISAFIEMSEEHMRQLQETRTLIRDRKKVATCLGFGPRFLHSTGQAYKGGPNTGVFLQITADPKKDIPVPGTHYTFGLVISAQAQADFEVLTKRGRRFLRIHLGNDVHAGLRKLHKIIESALSPPNESVVNNEVK